MKFNTDSAERPSPSCPRRRLISFSAVQLASDVHACSGPTPASGLNATHDLVLGLIQPPPVPAREADRGSVSIGQREETFVSRPAVEPHLASRRPAHDEYLKVPTTVITEVEQADRLPDFERGYDGIVIGAHARHDVIRLQGQSPVQDVVVAAPPRRGWLANGNFRETCPGEQLR